MNIKNKIKVEFCKKCVMSNQKVLPSVVTDDSKDHTNKINIPFIHTFAGKRINLLGKTINGMLKIPIKIVHRVKAL